MKKFYYGEGLYINAPEKGDVLSVGNAYVCPKCRKETASKVLDLWVLDTDLMRFKHKCLECGYVMERNFAFPQGVSAQDFVKSSSGNIYTSPSSKKNKTGFFVKVIAFFVAGIGATILFNYIGLNGELAMVLGLVAGIIAAVKV